MPLDTQSIAVVCINHKDCNMEKIESPDVKHWAILSVNKADKLILGGATYTLDLYRCNICGYVEFYDNATLGQMKMDGEQQS